MLVKTEEKEEIQRKGLIENLVIRNAGKIEETTEKD